MRRLLKPSLNWLLIFVPVAIAVRHWPALQNPVALFVCAGLAIIPLAGLMGQATEELGAKLGQGIGGLLNATFGNAAELIIAALALSKGLVNVVKASITGSIIGNLLLVLGVSMLAGGLKFPKQTFNKTAVRASTTSLALAAIGLLIPTVFHITAENRPGGWSPETEQTLSLAIGIILFLTYIGTLIFSLKTHRQHFAGGAHPTQTSDDGWSKTKSFWVLFVATVLVAWLSEFLVGSVEATREKLGLTEVFVGVVVVAIIGNAAEHSTAVMTAMKNKMDLSIGIAVGSSLQVALFVAPLLVFISYAFGQPMNFEFSTPEVVAVLVSVYVASQISGDGESNWLEGLQLVSLYLILAVLFYYLPGAGHVQ
jgi:Ca2+:H+ antiporter